MATATLVALIVAFVTVRGAVISELSDVAGSIQDLNQTIEYRGMSSASSSVAGSGFFDALDVADDPDDAFGQADNGIVFNLPPENERGPRVLLANGDFEQGIDPEDAIRTFGRNPDNPRVFLFSQDDIPNWQTTAPDGQVEVWESGFNGVESQAGDYHLEINANTPAQLFQEFTVAPGDDIEYSLWHRGRSGTDVANVLIGAPGSQTIEQTLTTGNTAWVNYTGTYTVPAGVTTLRFGLESVSTANNSPSVGNFIDNLEVFSVN